MLDYVKLKFITFLQVKTFNNFKKFTYKVQA